jgi:chaperonin GroES
MQFQLLGTKILVRRSKKSDKTDNGLFVPEALQKAPVEGVVLAVGPGVFDKTSGKHWPMTVKKGDKVIFNQFAGQFLEVENKLQEPDLIVLQDEDEILAIVQEK